MAASASALGRGFGLTTETRPSIQDIEDLIKHVDETVFLDSRQAFRKIAKEVLLPSVKRSFAAGVSPDGQRWAPLTGAYAARKKKAGVVAQLALQKKTKKLVREGVLDLSGDLIKSLTKAGKGSDGVRDFGKKFVRWGTTLSYSVPLQWGYGAKSFSARRKTSSGPSRSAGKRGDIEARPFVLMTKEMGQRAAEIYIEWVLDKVEEAAREAENGR